MVTHQEIYFLGLFGIFLMLFLNPIFSSYSLKRTILKLFGAEIGIDVIVKPNVNIKYPWKLKVGDYVWIGEGVWIDNLDFVYLGNTVVSLKELYFFVEIMIIQNHPLI